MERGEALGSQEVRRTVHRLLAERGPSQDRRGQVR